ncbi:TetR/AcrR family transcriptional regulator [Methanooceanicella nereidis]|nr:TetR/AcrR family transcriptional regulator [Methanocella sp. CWC-04]
MSIKELKEREKEQRRNYIVDVAERLFFSRGYDNVSMEDIAKEVGFNKATLYLYFKSKDALFFAIVLRGARIMDAAYAEGAKKGTDGLSKLWAMRLEFYEFSRLYPDYFRALCYSGGERFHKADDEAAKEVLGILVKNTKIITDTVTEGIEDGSIRNDIDPLELTIYLGVSNLGVLNVDPGYQKILEAKGISFDKFVKDFHRFIIPAIANRPVDDLAYAKGSDTGKRKRSRTKKQ